MSDRTRTRRRIVLWGSLHGRQYGSPLDVAVARLEYDVAAFELRIRRAITPAMRTIGRAYADAARTLKPILDELERR